MRRPTRNAPARPRSRRKTAGGTPAADAPPVPGPRNVGSVEALLSLALGVLMVVAALVPRSFKQLFLLGLGGGLVYRGLTGDGGLYRSLGVSTVGKLVAQE